jgi:homopolymeric O-antigen transport system permease protein
MNERVDKISSVVPTPRRVTHSAAAVPFWRYLDPIAFVRNLWRGRALIRQFTRREIEGRYKSSLLGLAWSFINPLILLVVYTFVFGVVFKQRWAGASEGLNQFGLVLFAGMITFGVFSECVGRAPTLVVSTPNFVKRVVFPLELLAVSVLGSALFHAAVSLVMLAVVHLVIGGSASWSWFLVPIALAPVACLSLGLIWGLSSLGVFIRDLQYAVTLILQVLFFMTPIFYPIEAVPPVLRAPLQLNPLTAIVTTVRGTIFPDVATAWPALGVTFVISIVAMLLGYAWFMRTRRSFGDVL